jgi:DNA-binding MarR family transcriptional regulator
MDKSTVNRNIDRLFKNKLLLKVDLHEIQTTIKGKNLLEKVIPAWDNAMAEIRSILGSEGEAALTTFHNKLKS